MNNTATIQQIVDKINSSTNILVAVSDNPSVDSLSSAIGLTLLLNKLDKHATAVFSGMVPPSITFLHPEKTFEANTNSLRDFIIALDKEKADHLRYKIEGDFVRIYITPYRTTIGKEDLEFSEGELNVDLVITLGVSDQKHLDRALESHGRVLHDSTIVALSKGEDLSQLGSIDWHEKDSSSLCEMVDAIVEPFNDQKKILDKQIATALLTGIVAETDRFSNAKTNSNSMTTAARLMAAGANQQLIAAKLENDHPANTIPTVSVNLNQSNAVIDKASAEQFIVDHKNDTLEQISNVVKNQPAPIEPTVSPTPNLETVTTATINPLPQPQPTASAQETLARDLIEQSISNPVMNSAMIPTPVVNNDIFTQAPAAFDSMVFNSAPAVKSVEPLSTTAIATASTNQQAALAGVAASFEPVSSLPMPPALPDFSKLAPTPGSVNSAYAFEPPVESTPKPADPTQYQIPGPF